MQVGWCDDRVHAMDEYLDEVDRAEVAAKKRILYEECLKLAAAQLDEAGEESLAVPCINLRMLRADGHTLGGCLENSDYGCVPELKCAAAQLDEPCYE